MISFVSDFLSSIEHDIAHDYCLSAKYSYGEVDNSNTPPTGMVQNISGHEYIYKVFNKKLRENFDFLDDHRIDRMYVNCFAPGENPYFHIDNDKGGYTALYYPNKTWERNDGGETQFLIDNNIQGVVPLPNRLVIFDSRLVHRATSFRDKHRFTYAIKFV